jgi:1,2-phenylacetyl-CoA epoxidase PaaB subunit
VKRRNVKQIKIWMVRRDLREKDIVAATGEERTYVNKTLNGLRNNRVVLQYLVDQGCPAKYLALPADMQAAA